uniref:Protein phosphatase 1 regulatory subunit n=1 Tax=Oryzias sinensis TaxID=183150 RepID=A0A8C7XK89_9TELE
MNGTSFLPALNPGGVQIAAPVNMAVRICLASSPPLRSYFSHRDNQLSFPDAVLPCCRPLRPCLSPGCCNAVATGTALLGQAATDGGQGDLRRRKQVAFADSRGLALTTVHVFDESQDNLRAELHFQLTEMKDAAAKLSLQVTDSVEPAFSLVLGFTPPAANYLELRNRLKAQQVCLETCSVHERLLSGTVQVQNICFEKSVWVRITFDSWSRFQDVPCRYLNNVYGCPDTDTFSFSILVPETLNASSRVEFCIRYQTGDNILWDNNLGNNYRLVLVEPGGRISERRAEPEVQRDATEFDQFGSPRTSAGFFSEWLDWNHVETGASYW